MRSLKETYTAQEVLELLAAISTAAFGWAGQGLAPEHEWYSVAFQDVFELRKKYDALLAQTRWIPVSEGLPEFPPETKRGGSVLCVYERDGEHRKVTEIYFTCDGFFEMGACEFAAPNWSDAGIRLIAWRYMPLPPLPKEVK